MPDVIDFQAAKEAQEPHCSGERKCIRCQHIYLGVWPLANHLDAMECPECGTFGTKPLGGIMPQEDELQLVCDCENDLFMVMSDGTAHCVNCGNRHDINA